MKLDGVLVAGYQVNSGTSTRDTRFPLGTLRMQAPYFSALGLDIEEYFQNKHVWGSLNVDVYPHVYEQVKSDWFFSNIHWTDLQPAENFFISKAAVHYDGQAYKALLYNPDPRTKPNHFQEPSIMEFVAEKIPGIAYGASLSVELPEGHLIIKQATGQRPPPLKSTAK